MSQFDESKIRRDDEGKFASKGPTAEADLALNTDPVERAARLAELDARVDEICQAWRKAESSLDAPRAGMTEPATTEEQKRLPGALISDERPVEQARATFVGLGHAAEKVDEALGHLVPKVRHDVDGNRYESLTDDQMDRAAEMVVGDPNDAWNHDCRECGQQIEYEASPNVKGSCNNCAGTYQAEDEADYGVGEDEHLGTYLREQMYRGYGDKGVEVYDRMVDQGRQVEGSLGPDVAVSDDLAQQMEKQASRELYGETPEVAQESRTPWGKAQVVETCAPGVVFASTANHGGYKLSPERNKAIPAPFRQRSGWYDEDDGTFVVGMYHPDAMRPKEGTDHSDVAAQCAVRLRDREPDAYEKATGTTIPFGVSSGKDEADYYSDKKGKTLVFSSRGTEDPEHPGYVRATTRVHGGEVGNRSEHLIPKDAYDSLSREHGAARNVSPVLPAGSIDATPAPPVSTWQRPAAVTTVSTQGLSPSAQARVNKDMDRLWRDRNGEVRSLRSMIEKGRINGKSAYVDNGKRTYALVSQESETEISSFQVAKATFDAYDGPDTRSEAQIARQEMSFQSHKLEKAREALHLNRRFTAADRDAIAKAQARFDKAEAEYRRVSGQ